MKKIIREEFEELNRMPSLWTRNYFVSIEDDEINIEAINILYMINKTKSFNSKENT